MKDPGFQARQVARARIGRAVRAGDPLGAARARRDYYALKIEEAIQRNLAEAGPLTAEQREHLARLLLTAGE